MAGLGAVVFSVLARTGLVGAVTAADAGTVAVLGRGVGMELVVGAGAGACRADVRRGAASARTRGRLP